MTGLLPEHWRRLKLGLCLHRRKVTVMPSSMEEAVVGLVGLEDIQDGGRGGVAVRQIKPQEIESLKTRFEPGDVLYGKLRPYLNKVAIAPEAGLCSTEIWAFTTSSFVHPKFAAFFLASSFFVERVASLTKGANLPRLDTDAFDSGEIPLPPLSEQQRIVEILQEAKEIRCLRAEVEARTADLIPAMFNAYFGDPVQNPKKWRVEPLASVIKGMPKNGLYKPGELYGEGTPIIRIGDFTGGVLRTSKSLQRLRLSEEEIKQFGLSNGQILVNRVNSIEHLGKSLLVSSLTEPTVYESNMMRLDTKREKVLPDFLIVCLQHPALVAKLRAKAKKAINQASINQTDVLTLSIPIPPISAQKAFVAEVEQVEVIRLLGETSQIVEKALNVSLSAHAFSGHLTAGWRLQHEDHLEREATERDELLKSLGVLRPQSRLSTVQETANIFADRTDGIHAELNREQQFLYRQIKRMVGGVDYGRYFTAEQLADYVEGALHRNPQAIESHLLVFSVRGLVIPLSKRRPVSGEAGFASCYRLPLKRWNDEQGDAPEADDDLRVELMGIQRRLATGNV